MPPAQNPSFVMIGWPKTVLLRNIQYYCSNLQPRLGRYCCGRDGNYLMGVPFECDLCSLRNLCGRQPSFGSKRDQFTLTCIRRVQLDVMWAREHHTVASNWSSVERYLINYPHLSDYGQTIFCLSFPSRDRATAPGQYEQFYFIKHVPYPQK
jgi:hypothetical protein